MIPGFYVIDDHSVYTDWLDRQGDKCIVQFEVLDLSTSGSVEVKPYTKSTNQNASASSQTQLTTSGGSLASVTLNSKGLFELDLTEGDIKDEIRFQFSGLAGGESLEWVNLRVLGVVWFDTAS